MRALTQSDRAAVAEIVDALVRFDDRSRVALAGLTPALRALMGAEKLAAMGIVPRDGAFGLEFGHTSGMGPEGRARDEIARFLRSQKGRFGYYNPLTPEPSQRNRALTTRALDPNGDPVQQTNPIARELYPRIGCDRRDQLRALICEGDELLCWLGGLRPEPFTARETARLQAIIPALRTRLVLERDLRISRLRSAALDVLLEELASPAFILGADGSVLHANASGWLALRRSRTLAAQLRESIAPQNPAPAFRITPVASPGLPRCYLARSTAPATRREDRLARLARHFGLTPRQQEVLRLLAQGHSNKELAERLSCTSGTAALHVSAVLKKSGERSRAALVARVLSSHSDPEPDDA